MAQGRKKLKFNPVSGNLDLVIDNNGVYVPMDGTTLTDYQTTSTFSYKYVAELAGYYPLYVKLSGNYTTVFSNGGLITIVGVVTSPVINGTWTINTVSFAGGFTTLKVEHPSYNDPVEYFSDGDVVIVDIAEDPVRGNINMVASPSTLPGFGALSLVTDGLLQAEVSILENADTAISNSVTDVATDLTTHLNDLNNPHDVNAFDVNLDQLTNDKQIPLSGTLIGSNGAVIPSVAIIGIGGSTYRFFFTTSPSASGLVLGDTFQVTGALINPDFNQTDWVVTSVEINPYQYTFEAQSPSVGAGEPNNGFSSLGSTAAGGANNVQELSPSAPVTGNIQFTADPNTLPNWGRVSVASKGYVDDQVGANNGLSEILANDNTATVDIEITDATKGIILTSPNLTRWRVTVGNDGSLTTTSL